MDRRGYLKGAKTFTDLFQWFALPQNIGWVNFLNEWGLTLIGISLILGLFVRLSSFFGIILMLLYYFPVLTFPYIRPHSFVIDDHIMYSLVFFLLIAFRAGRIWGMDRMVLKLSVFSKRKSLKNLLG